MEEELGDTDWRLCIFLRGLLNDESATMVRDDRCGEQQTPFVSGTKPLLAYAGQLEQSR